MKWLTLDEAAQRTGWTVRTVRRYIDSGRLVAYRATGGRTLRLRSDDVDGLFLPVVIT